MSGEHVTRNTEHGVLKFCGRCGRLTRHYVWDVRVGACMEHEAQAETKKQAAARRRRERESENPRLF